MKEGWSDWERRVQILLWVNVGVWTVSLISLAFITRHAPSAKGLLPILIGGVGVAVALISLMFRKR